MGGKKHYVVRLKQLKGVRMRLEKVQVGEGLG